MGMDVFGLEPRSEIGAYFRANVWYWHPLASFCEALTPDITRHCEYWHSNDGRGLNDEHSRALSAALIEAIGDGAVESVIAGREAYLAELPADSFERWYVLDLATIREFAAFLADCGGFEIW